MKVRNWTWLNGLVVVLLVGGLAGAADDKKDNPTGTWGWTFTTPNGDIKVTAKLKAEGEKVTGTVSARDRESKIENGKFKNGELTFQVTREIEGGKFVMKYTGKVKGDSIDGKAGGEREGQTFELDWNAKREKASK
jgi:hypothetical protein